MLPTDRQARKNMPIATGCVDYFPDALAAVAHVSFVGNETHNPGEKLHWSRDKSDDHPDCLMRHFLERGTLDDDGLRHSAKLAWRALALLQLECEGADAEKAKPDPITEWLLDEDDPTQTYGLPAFLSHLKTRPRCYIAAKMRGVPDLNAAGFERAERTGRIFGYDPISPLQMDKDAGVDLTPGREYTEDEMRAIIRRDVTAILELSPANGDAIAMVPGWETSVGACAEFFLARFCGLAILDAETFEPLLDVPDFRAILGSVLSYLSEHKSCG